MVCTRLPNVVKLRNKKYGPSSERIVMQDPLSICCVPRQHEVFLVPQSHQVALLLALRGHYKTEAR